MTTTILIGLAAARLTRLWVKDTITERMREWTIRHVHGNLEVLFACPWCISAYLTALAGLAAWIARPVLVLLAAWQIAVTVYWATQALARYGADE